MNRRQFLCGFGLLALSGAGYAGLEFWPENGLSNPCLSKLPDEIKQHPLMQEIWRDIRPELIWDTHIHLVGTGDSNSVIWSSPNMDSYLHPILKVQKNFYMNGSCAVDGDIDHSTVQRMLTQLMDTPDYQQLVFGEISAITLINHAWAIKPLLQRTDWQHRLLNGSDYPLPGILPLINTQSLAKQGLLNMEYVPFLQALKNHNALLFDFAVKRLIALDGTKFANSVFETKSFFKIEQ